MTLRGKKVVLKQLIGGDAVAEKEEKEEKEEEGKEEERKEAV